MASSTSGRRAAAAGVSETGPVRTVNEDHWFVDADRGLFIVADGMGGHQAGEVAARLAVAEVVADIDASVAETFAWPLGRVAGPRACARLRHALRRANEAVVASAAADPALIGMGTTLTVLLLAADGDAVGSVGDSRAYLVRGELVEQVTNDDTWLVSVFGKDGATQNALARTHPMRHVLTSVIGARDAAEPEVRPVELAAGDTFVLASDGLHNVVDDHRLGVLAREASVEVGARRLVDEALARGTTDNVTVVVVRTP